MLPLLLIIVPVLAIVSSAILYQLNGQREILKFDTVQFYYAFIIAPLLFIWGKSFLYFLLREEIDISLSQNEIFFWDTLFSLLAMFVFGFVVMHALTKSFNLQRKRDPLYDIFKLSEYFHLWITHVVMFVGSMILISLVAILNAYFELPILMDLPRIYFYVALGFGFLFGVALFLAIWLSDPRQHEHSFTRLMKLSIATLFVIHVTIYLIWTPPFDIEHSFFWGSLILFSTATSLSFFTYKSYRFKTGFDKFSGKLKHPDWDFRLQVMKEFGKKKER